MLHPTMPDMYITNQNKVLSLPVKSQTYEKSKATTLTSLLPIITHCASQQSCTAAHQLVVGVAKRSAGSFAGS